MLLIDIYLINDNDFYGFLTFYDDWGACFWRLGDEVSGCGFWGVTCFKGAGTCWGGLLIVLDNPLFPFF